MATGFRISSSATPPGCRTASCPGMPLARAQYTEIRIFLTNYLLSSQGDRMAMANAVEGRYPFLDYRVIEVRSPHPSRGSS